MQSVNQLYDQSPVTQSAKLLNHVEHIFNLCSFANDCNLQKLYVTLISGMALLIQEKLTLIMLFYQWPAPSLN